MTSANVVEIKNRMIVVGFVFVAVIVAIIITIYIQSNVQCDYLGMGNGKRDSIVYWRVNGVLHTDEYLKKISPQSLINCCFG